jgi:hypothetical protein
MIGCGRSARSSIKAMAHTVWHSAASARPAVVVFPFFISAQTADGLLRQAR